MIPKDLIGQLKTMQGAKRLKDVRFELQELIDDLEEVNRKFEDELIIVKVRYKEASEGHKEVHKEVLAKPLGRWFCTFPTLNGWSVTHTGSGLRATWVKDSAEAEWLVGELEKFEIDWDFTKDDLAVKPGREWDAACVMCRKVNERQATGGAPPKPKTRPRVRVVRLTGRSLFG